MSILLAAALVVAQPNIDNSSDVTCMAQAIHHEARGEPVAGQEAVGQVILNRVRSGRFSGSVCGVVFQRSQFSRISRRIRPNSASFAVARRVLRGISRNLIGNRLYFNGTGPIRAIRVGRHRFW